jgi:hypothetical protein
VTEQIGHSTRYPSATVTLDHLYEPGASAIDDEVSRSWTLARDVTECADPVTALAYDDDGELYYTLSVILPTDRDEEEDALDRMLAILGRHAGVTRVDFPGRPDLDIG